MASNPTATTTIQPLQYAKETILGMTISLEQRFGCTPRNDLNTTLNKKYGVFPTRLPVGPRLVKYFSWGVGGRTNDSTTLSSAQFALGTNLSLYKPRPFRVVPLEEDLSAEERAQYGMRQVKLINNTQYVLYYLKLINFTQSQVQYVRTDPISGAIAPYELDQGGLNPEPPVSDSNGVITDVTDAISVVLPGSLTITGQEVMESMSVIDGGDTRFAIASELGFVSASTEQVQAIDANGKPFTYAEAIMAQMVDQYNWVGQPFMSTSDSWTRSMNFSLKNTVIGS